MEGWGPASSSTPRRARGPREAGRPWGAVPGGGGGGDAAAAAAAVAAAAVAFAGATAASSGRDAERASESGGEERGARHSWIPHSNFKPRPRPPASLAANRRAPWTPSRAPIGRPPWQCGRGAPGENHSWNPAPTPKPGTAPLSSSRPRVDSRRPEPIRRLPGPTPLSYWPPGSRDSPGGSPGKSECSARGPGVAPPAPAAFFVRDPFIGRQPEGGAQLRAGLASKGGGGRPGVRVTRVPGRNLGAHPGGEPERDGGRSAEQVAPGVGVRLEGAGLGLPANPRTRGKAGAGKVWAWPLPTWPESSPRPLLLL